MTADQHHPAPPPPQHPDLDTLADYDADVLDPATAERVAAHVAGCVRCTESMAAFGALRADLRGLPAPALPAVVAARLDATLADLRRGDPGRRGEGRDGPGRAAPTRPPLTPVPSTPSASAGSGAAGSGAAGSGAAGFGAAGSGAAGSSAAGSSAGGPGTGGSRPGGPGAGGPGPASPDGSGFGPARRPDGRSAEPDGSPPGPVPRDPDDLAFAREMRRRRRSRRLSAVAAAFVLLAAGASVGALVRAGTNSADNAATGAAAPLDTEQGAGDGAGGSASVAPGGVGIPSYSKDSLRASLPRIERDSAVEIITGRGDTGPAGAMADTARRTACAGTIRGSSGDLRAVRRITYDGRPAYVFVFATAGRLTAYVVSDECGTSPALPAAVLDTVS